MNKTDRQQAEAVAATARFFGLALPEADPVNINFDWLPNPRDGRVVFQIRISRRGQISATDFEIDLCKLAHDELESLNTFLSRCHAGLGDGYEITRIACWLVDRSIAQAEPSLSDHDRGAKVRELLLAH
jgi:hypothetical protein